LLLLYFGQIHDGDGDDDMWKQLSHIVTLSLSCGATIFAD